MAKSESIEMLDGTVLIRELIIDDLNTHRIIKDIPKNDREKFVKQAIIIGSIGLRNISLVENVDYIEKEFSQLLNQFESHSEDFKNMVEELFDIDNTKSSFGKFRLMFERYFDVNKGVISDLLNPYEENSPIKKLKDELFQKIAELRDEVIKETVRDDVASKTTLKGIKFEHIVLDQVEEICKPYEDVVTFVGDNIGKRNKIGDINIDINGNEEKRITIECKNSPAYSNKKTTDEINNAINNRDAQFGIFLFKDISQIPSALKPIKITNSYIVTSFDKYGLYFAVRVARLFVEKSTDTESGTLDLKTIEKVIETIRIKIQSFNNIQIKLTQIDNASKYIRENMEQLKKDIEEGLQNIELAFRNHIS